MKNFLHEFKTQWHWSVNERQIQEFENGYKMKPQIVMANTVKANANVLHAQGYTILRKHLFIATIQV